MRLRPAPLIVALGSALFLMGAGDASHTQPANPAYAQWARFKPGTYVTIKQVVRSTQDAPGVIDATAHPPEGSESLTTSRLAKLNKQEAVVLEQTTAIDPGVETEMPVIRLIYPAKGGENGPVSTSPQPNTTVTEGNEDVTINGRKIATHWVASSVSVGGEVSKSKVWLSDAVPGGMVKDHVEKFDSGKKLSDSVSTVVDFKAIAS